MDTWIDAHTRLVSDYTWIKSYNLLSTRPNGYGYLGTQ